MKRRRILGLFFASIIFSICANLHIFGQTTKNKSISLASGSVDIPINFKIEHFPGDDFYVDYIYANEPEGKENAVLWVYAGDFPDFEPPKNAKTKKIKLGDRKIKWFIWEKQKNKKTVYHYEALIKFPGGGAYHLGVSGFDKKKVENLFAVFNTYRIPE